MCMFSSSACPTLCDPMDYSPRGSSVHGIFQARILKQWSFPAPGNLPDKGIKLASLALIDGFFTTAPSGNATEYVDDPTNKNDPLGSVTARLRYLILPVGDLQ